MATIAMNDYQLLDDRGQATVLTNFLTAHRGYRRDAVRFPAGMRSLVARGLPAEGVDALRRFSTRPSRRSKHWRRTSRCTSTSRRPTSYR